MYYERNRDVILSRAKDYNENNKERLRQQARDKYRNLSEEKKQKVRIWKKTDIIICLKERLKYIKKINMRLKSFNIIINKIVLIVHALIYAN